MFNYSSSDFVNFSILHGGDRSVGDEETLADKWSPSIWVGTLLMSLQIVIQSPNLDSPANVDARILFTRFLDVYCLYFVFLLKFFVATLMNI